MTATGTCRLVSKFSLLIKPASADCNMRCDYCFAQLRAGLYLSGEHRMAHDVLERLISTYLATNQDAYTFAWQGGEPALMGIDFYRQVLRLQRRHARPGAVVGNALQTNATLVDDQFAQFLARFRFLVGVSADGPPDLHDLHRKMADGSPSHAWVVEGVRHLRRYGVEHNVLVAVSAGNVAHGARIYRYLVDQGFLHHQYIPCVNLRADGSPDSHTVSGEQWGAFLNEVYDAWRVSDTHRVSVRLFDSVIERLVDGVANTCSMGSDCRQYFVVEHNGDVFPCDFFVEAAHRLGNVMTDSWYGLLESAQYARFGRRKSVLATGCASCRYRQLCGGDCPRHRRDPEGGRRSPSSLCRGWKAFYDHALPELNAIAATLGRKRRPGLRNDEREDDGRDDR